MNNLCYSKGVILIQKESAMSEEHKPYVTLDDQINYLESYAALLKAQQVMIEQQVKMLKTGKALQDNILGFQNMFMNMGNWWSMPPSESQGKEYKQKDKL